MAGFGFLKQMSETLKYNRDLLGKTKRQPFDNGDYKNNSADGFKDEKRLTEKERQELISSVFEGNRKETRKRILILIIAITIIISLYFGFIPLLELIFN